VGPDVRGDDAGLEVGREVEDEVIDVELLGDPAGVVDVGDAAAPGVALAAPQAHRHADDVVSVALQQRGGNGRVDAAAHRDHHLHDVTGPPLRCARAAWRRPT
jgi:hypothetical protein